MAFNNQLCRFNMFVKVFDDHMQQSWRDKDIFAEVAQLDGDIYRDLDGRRTLRFEHGGRRYFVKHHIGIGWAEIFKNLLSLRKPIISARNEFEAIESLHAMGISTMTVAAYGERGLNPARKESFIITEALENCLSLEDVINDWEQKPLSPAMKNALIDQLGKLAGTMHGGGLNHRDFYLCHFLCPAHIIEQEDIPGIDLILIDLHRALHWKKVPQRWLVKDIAALYFSAMALGLSKEDVRRFIDAYQQHNPAYGQDNHRFWQAVNKRAAKFYRKFWNAPPPSLTGV